MVCHGLVCRFDFFTTRDKSKGKFSLDTASNRIELLEVNDQPTLDIVFAIRKQVFVVEQQVDPEEEYDEFEVSSRHFLLKVAGEGVATGRFRSTNYGWKIERMAVLTEHRGRQYGARVLDAMVAALPQDGRIAYLHAQEHALEFYLKKGFTVVGERFWEANIPHFKMTYSRK